MRKILWVVGGLMLIGLAFGKSNTDTRTSADRYYNPTPAEAFDQAMTKIARDHAQAQRDNSDAMRDAMARIGRR
jgi:hypothetical protein